MLQVKPVKPLTIEKKIGGEKNGETRIVLLKKRRNYYPTADKYELNTCSSMKVLWLLYELFRECVNLYYVKGSLLLSCFDICLHSQRRYLNECGPWGNYVIHVMADSCSPVTACFE
jgi:hypothetical protein